MRAQETAETHLSSLHLDCRFWETLWVFLSPRWPRDRHASLFLLVVGPAQTPSAASRPPLLPFYVGPQFTWTPSWHLASPTKSLAWEMKVLISHGISKRKEMWDVRHLSCWGTSRWGLKWPLKAASNCPRISNLDPRSNLDL